MSEQISLQMVPPYLLEDIMNRLQDARDIAKAQSVCKEFREAGNLVRSLLFVVLDAYHERARNIDMASLSSSIPGKSQPSSSSAESTNYLRFKEQLVKILEKKRFLVQLRVEVESKLQAKSVSQDEKRRRDFWISDPNFVRKWVSSSLEHLCIVDYGQQAIMRRSTIIKILSETCKRLKTLDLRNMFLDTSDCVEMPSMLSLTWRCVKVTGGALQDINNAMPKLRTMALLGVFGVEAGNLTFTDMKVLCFGLSTPAKDVEMNLPSLEKLQLKMQCPQKLIITAPTLKYVAFNLEVNETTSRVELNCSAGLQELLYGASSFATLSRLMDKNPRLTKLFLDIPCMALAEDGRFLGVLKDIELTVPKLHPCEVLEVLNIGPGLWHSLETKPAAEEKWPSVPRLILHMIPHSCGNAVSVLQSLLTPSVSSLTLYVHTSSPVSMEILKPIVEDIVSSLSEQHIEVEYFPWTKSLDFSCFSF